MNYVSLGNKIKLMNDFDNWNEILRRDNSSSTNLKYDILMSKILAGAENHRRYSSKAPLLNILEIIIAFLKVAVSIVVMMFCLLKCFYNNTATYRRVNKNR